MSAPTLMQSCAIRSASPGGQTSPEVAAAHHVSADGTGSRPTQRRPGKSSRAHGSSAGAHASADGLPLTRCPGGKSQPLTDHRAHVSAQWSHEPGTRDRAWSASRKPAGRPQSRRSCQQPPPDIRTSKHLKADIRALTAAVLSCCTRSSGFRIISLTCGAMGIRTPDLLHAMEPTSVHDSPPPFVIDAADQVIRSRQSARVHQDSLRTITNTVTSRPWIILSSNTETVFPGMADPLTDRSRHLRTARALTCPGRAGAPTLHCADAIALRARQPRAASSQQHGQAARHGQCTPAPASCTPGARPVDLTDQSLSSKHQTADNPHPPGGTQGPNDVLFASKGLSR